MGSSSWSNDHYAAKAAFRASTGAPTFAYHSAVTSGKASGAHPSLDPKGVKIRESRDSDAHPLAIPIMVLCDVTGSMQSVPKTVQENLPKLMGLLIRRGYLEHPAILVGAIGDATCDKVPLQVGQFESGIEIEDNLTNLYLEGGGGGQQTESYELALYFAARHTAHDHYDKRGEKGYLFLIGDEMPYPQVKPTEVESVIDAKIQEPIPVEAILDEVRERYHVFYVLPKMTSNFNDRKIRQRWKELLGENVIILDDAKGICECIAAQVGVFQGATTGDAVEADLIAVGSSTSVAKAVSKALVPAGAGAPSSGAIQSIPDSGSSSGLSSF